jgi:PKHD-type hydroxylase
MKLTTNPHNIPVNYPYATWANAFSSEEVDRIVKECDAQGVVEGVVGSDQGVDYSYRKSQIRMQYVNSNNDWIFKRLCSLIEQTNDQFFQYDLTGFEFFQYTTYGPGEYYHYHVDTQYQETNISKDNHLTRKLSISILLNDPNEFEGGNFDICVGSPDVPLSNKLEKGTAIFFPSHMLHRVSSITRGVRKSLVVWVLGPKFK